MAELNFDSRVNYQKIHLEGKVDLTVSNPNVSTVHTVPHGLGYIPNIRVWFTNGNGDISTAVTDAAGSNLYPITSAYTRRACHYTVNSTNLNLVLHRGSNTGASISSTIYYRIYTDAA